MQLAVYAILTAINVACCVYTWYSLYRDIVKPPWERKYWDLLRVYKELERAYLILTLPKEQFTPTEAQIKWAEEVLDRKES